MKPPKRSRRTRPDRDMAPAERDQPKLYRDLASWWPLLSPREDYAEEAEFMRKTIMDACQSPPETVLELGSGGGSNASYLKAHFRMTLVDLSSGMLAGSRALNPECEHIQGDMRTVRLGRLFDVVFIHDAIGYMTTEADLRRAFETAYLHCRPGGLALLAPDDLREDFKPSLEHGGHDGPTRGMRYLEWNWDPDPDDTTYTADFAFLLHDEKGELRVEQDRHILGLFSRDVWMRLLSEVGFEPRAVPHVLGEPGVKWCDIFVALKPSGK